MVSKRVGQPKRRLVRYIGKSMLRVVVGDRPYPEQPGERRSPSQRVIVGFNRAAEGREPWTEPYTRRERLEIYRDAFRYNRDDFFKTSLPRSIAWRLPRRVVLWCFIRVSSNVKLGPNEGPEAITYERGYKEWATGDAWYEASDR